ncbi:MAG: CBS domain-containing protein [Calditerrivibrio sp.]|nr:CBS domain-containing protein [Calditerrivibrio sp.]MCA1980183.1 CBS domain-containing protein [Calditerrivibrio sp.]
MKIVITHHNPDFDAFSSAYAAFKLHNCDKIFISHTVEANVGKYIEDMDFGIPYAKVNERFIEQFDSEIELLVITDCKLTTRLKYLNKLTTLAKKIIIYDHHHTDNIDIMAEEIYLEKIGATVSIITKKLKENNITLTKDEATLLMMGIYEDTGFLTFNTTTVEDMEAAAFLLKNRADLPIVSEYIKRELSKEQILLLNELIVNTTIFMIDKVFIGVTHANTDEYIGDIAFLAHKLIEMENFDALFLSVRVSDRVVVVGRSRTDKVDVSKILYFFGGGGHPSAGSAIVKDLTLNETLQKLKNLINEHISPIKFAKDLMTTPVKFVHTGQTIKDAIELFMKYNLNVMPVVKNDKTLGLIFRRDILHGVKHRLENEPVDSIMQTEFETITPSTPIDEVKDIMLLKNQKMVPVELDNKLLGVITRTDLLRLMKEEMIKMPRFANEKAEIAVFFKSRNVTELLKDKLPEDYFDLLNLIGITADELDLNAYVVGGFVRDLLMGNENFDVDIVVELDATKLAKEVAKKFKAKVAVHEKFKTAVVILNDGKRIDFATARTEYYNMPASAPEVEISSIKNDLFRRDFTINAMAIRINKKSFGTLLDFYGGQRDIIDKKIRVLHNLSFIDDPSRGLRAIRFLVRFGFEIGPHTHKLLKHAIQLKLFDRILGNRLFLELKYILSEKNYYIAIQKLTEYGIMKFFSQKFKLDEHKKEIFENFERYSIWYEVQCGKDVKSYMVRFLILFQDHKKSEFESICDRLEFANDEKNIFVESFARSKYATTKIRKNPNMKNSELYLLLKNLADEFILFILSMLGDDYEYIIKKYVTELRNIKLHINGNDLIAIGFKPSIAFNMIFNQLIMLKLDNMIKTKEDEIDMAKKLYEEFLNGK